MSALLSGGPTQSIAEPSPKLTWITTVRRTPYFQTETGEPWHPIGHNDAISWRELSPLYRRKDVAAVEGYLRDLVDHGVTCIRLMLEYAQVRHRNLETTTGCWSTPMVQYWDDFFSLCERVGLRILLTPFDTFWMWLKFDRHPYNQANGGPLSHPSQALLSRPMREAIKARLAFAAERWGGSGALFAWDLWNEIHPAQANMSSAPFFDFIEELSTHVRAIEIRRFGRAHPQTVSLFGPELSWRPELQMEAPIFRHPALDFATIHIYSDGTIDAPKNTVDPAISMGQIVKESLAEITDNRPFFDTEHGPIHTFKDKRKTLPESFDNEYFRHMQWAHLASGGAGGGMRWPNRHPHCLTPGMRDAQHACSRFLSLIDWHHFDRKNVTDSILVRNGSRQTIASSELATFACASNDQAILYLLRRDSVARNGQLARNAKPLRTSVRIPQLQPGTYQVTCWDTEEGRVVAQQQQDLACDGLLPLPEFVRDLALAVRSVR